MFNFFLKPIRRELLFACQTPHHHHGGHGRVVVDTLINTAPQTDNTFKVSTRETKHNKNKMFRMNILIVYHLNSPGHRPMACQILHQLLFCSSVVFFFTSPRARGGPWDPPGQKCTTWRRPWRAFSALGAPRLDFFRFFCPSGRRPKMMIFWHRSKTSKIKR